MGKTKPQPGPLPEARKLEIVQAAIGLIHDRIKSEEISASLSDLIRLLEIEAELSGSATVRQITAGWKDPEKPFGPKNPTPEREAS